MAKAATETLRDQARTVLNQYRTNSFPTCQSAVNTYLSRFNAGFSLGNVCSANTRGGSTCTYDVVINNTSVSVGGGTPAPGSPSFRNTLSSGDRNALALAFFLASLDQDPGLADKVVVIDDPISSMDEHRTLTTPYYLFVALSIEQVGLYQAKQRTVIASTLPHLRIDRISDFIIPLLDNEKEISNLAEEGFILKEKSKSLTDKTRLIIEDSFE